MWGLQLAMERKFFVFKRRVRLESTMKLIVASFSAEAVLVTETATMDHHGSMIN